MTEMTEAEFTAYAQMVMDRVWMVMKNEPSGILGAVFGTLFMRWILTVNDDLGREAAETTLQEHYLSVLAMLETHDAAQKEKH
jgi:hypothetical protein